MGFTVFSGPAQGASSQYSSYQQGQGQQYGSYRASQTGPSAQQQRPYGYEQVNCLNLCSERADLAVSSVYKSDNLVQVYGWYFSRSCKIHRPKEIAWLAVSLQYIILQLFYFFFNRDNMEITSNKRIQCCVRFLSIVSFELDVQAVLINCNMLVTP